MFRRMVSLNSMFSWATTAIWLPQIARGNFPQIHATDFDGAFARVVKSQQQIGEGSFAGTGLADKGHELAGFDVEIDVLQDGFFTVVETDIFKLDVGVAGWSILGWAGSGTEFFVAIISKTRSVAARACTIWFCRRVRFFSG